MESFLWSPLYITVNSIIVTKYDLFDLDSGRAISFKPDDETTFLVGTEEGIVYLCTTQYSSRSVPSS